MTRIAIRLRRGVWAASGGRCAFCQSAMELMGVTFEVDHIVPLSAGGTTTLENLCLCCPTCNRHKAARTDVDDPVTRQRTRLFHPVRDRWRDHFDWREEATVLAGRTPIERATIEALHMNRPQIIELRRYWAATGRHPPVP